MAYQNCGTFDIGTVGTNASRAAGGNAMAVMDSASIASGGAFLNSELEKRDNMVRTPLTSMTYPRDIPIRVGGGWSEFVSAMSVGYGIPGGSEDGIVHAPGANGIPMVQADFNKGLWKTHVVALGLRVMWVDMQRGNMTGRSYETLLKEGLRMAYDKHLEANTYVGIKKYGTTGILNNPDVAISAAAAVGSGNSTRFQDKTPQQALDDINRAILTVWSAAENDRDAIPNHIIMPYEQYNFLATTKVTELAEKTILQFLLENNVAKANGGNLFIGAASWCKGAGTGGTDRMAVYVNKERYLAEDELMPLSRAMTSPNTADFCYDTAYAGNISEVQVFYDQTMIYVDGI